MEDGASFEAFPASLLVFGCRVPPILPSVRDTVSGCFPACTLHVGVQLGGVRGAASRPALCQIRPPGRRMNEQVLPAPLSCFLS